MISPLDVAGYAIAASSGAAVASSTSGIMARFGGWLLAGIGLPLAGGFGAWAIRKWLLPAYQAKIRAAIQKALNPATPDPKLNELLRAYALAGVKLAEYFIPDRGKGSERFVWLDAQLAKAHIPEKIRKILIEEGIGVMDDELKEAAKTNFPG